MTQFSISGVSQWAGVRSIALAALLLLFHAPASFAANFGEEIAETFKNGEFDVNFRYRYEFVDQSDNGRKDANASTLRTRLVYRTAKWNDFDVTLNMDDVRTVVASNYSSTRNGKTQYQTVPDPKGTSLNIAALTYSGIDNAEIVLGRQRIKRGNDRFIGNVGWRQNEQTYDAISYAHKGERFQAFYAYVDQVNRIFGPESGSPSDVFSSDSHLADAAFTLSEAIAVAAYGYWLDLDNRSGAAGAFAASNQTYGARVSGAPKFGEGLALTYAAEFAAQEDYGDNPTDYDANYMLAELGLKIRAISVRAGYEVLEADDQAGFAFQTPLATLHAFNGWADRFVVTPATGLEDIYLAASAGVAGGTLQLILHDFSAESGSADYGQEIDFSASWPLGEHYSILGKLAFYSGDSSAPGTLHEDTTKAWLQFTAAF